MHRTPRQTHLNHHSCASSIPSLALIIYYLFLLLLEKGMAQMGDEAPNQLPPGFHFFPTDEELVLHFLRPKATLSFSHHLNIIPSLDPSLQHPWELTGKALAGGDGWYFFSKKPGAGGPASANGHWTAVGEDEPVVSGNDTVGVKKFLAFCDGEGTTTSMIWMMHEFHLSDQGCSSSTTGRRRRRRRRSSKKGTTQESSSWVLCRLFERSCYDEDEDEDDDDDDDDDGSAELSGLDEVFLSVDDVEDISLPKD